MTFKIKVIAKEGFKNPHKETFEYSGEDVDIYVKDLMRNYIYRHGFKDVKVQVLLVTPTLRIEKLFSQIRLKIGHYDLITELLPDFLQL